MILYFGACFVGYVGWKRDALEHMPGVRRMIRMDEPRVLSLGSLFPFPAAWRCADGWVVPFMRHDQNMHRPAAVRAWSGSSARVPPP